MAKRTKAPEEEPGLTLEDLFEDTLTFVTTFWKGRPLTIEWAPLRFTAALEDRVKSLELPEPDDDDDEAPEGDDDAAKLARALRQVAADERKRDYNRAQVAGARECLAEVIVSWSLKGRDGHPIASTEEALRSLPDAFINGLLNEVSANAGPKAVSSDPSEPLP